jgi:hypothetical protein
MPEVPQWARVRSDMNCHIRRGAWYEVLRLMGEEAVLEVNRKPVRLERASLQIVPLRPQRWSVVARPRDSVDMPLNWGSRYAVCPGCCSRQALPGKPAELRCGKCAGIFAIAWDDRY